MSNRVIVLFIYSFSLLYDFFFFFCILFNKIHLNLDSYHIYIDRMKLLKLLEYYRELKSEIELNNFVEVT